MKEMCVSLSELHNIETQEFALVSFISAIKLLVIFLFNSAKSLGNLIGLETWT